jgi:hypothetical protein
MNQMGRYITDMRKLAYLNGPEMGRKVKIEEEMERN